ncbi:YraN family protein [Patescibacteria group bacterium]|nr:YraN family protein [Patescibacteria group bacterium]
MALAVSDLGRCGEDLALEFFLGRGFLLVDRNWRCRFGEIDLLVEQAKTLHFVEVKMRLSKTQHPFEAISGKKRLHLERAIELWLQAHPSHEANPYQVDAFFLWKGSSGIFETEWIQGI